MFSVYYSCSCYDVTRTIHKTYMYTVGSTTCAPYIFSVHYDLKRDEITFAFFVGVSRHGPKILGENRNLLEG